jgi:phosphoribosylanthranilate isomerase
MPVAVKICGITCVEDAELCVAEGADAIGLNFYARSPRCIDVATARDIVAAVGARVLTVGVFVDAGYDEIARMRDATGMRCVQLHGDETPELLARFLPHAYKALRVRDARSIERARAYAGEHILLDAYVPGQAGGTGATFRWELATELARQRKVTLAGGLQPENVAAAVAQVQPFCVDVASGVETSVSARRKDRARVHAFISTAKAARA